MHSLLLFWQTLTCICEWICIVHVMWTKWCTMITMATWTITVNIWLILEPCMVATGYNTCEGSWLPRSEGCLPLQELPVYMSLYGSSKLCLSLLVQVRQLERLSLSPRDSSPSVSRVPFFAISAAFLLPSLATGSTPTDWRSSGNVYTLSKPPSPQKPSVIAVHREQTWALIIGPPIL